jgi:hypothetical protein
MKKSRIDKQIVSVSEWTDEIKRAVFMRSVGAFLVSFGSACAFWGLGILPLWVVWCISILVMGGIWFMGSYDVETGIGQWLIHLVDFRSTEESDGEPQEPIKVNGKSFVPELVGRKEGGEVVKIPMTVNQIYDVFEAGLTKTHLRRSDLSQYNWPNLSRDWHEGIIQEKLRRLGIIDEENMFVYAGYDPSSQR